MKSKAINDKSYYTTKRGYSLGYIKNMLTCQELVEEQRITITEFHDFCKSGGSTGRLKSLFSLRTTLMCIKHFGIYIKKDFSMATKADIINFINSLQDKGLSESYVSLIKIHIKAFYKWLYQTENYPDIVKWLKPKLGAKKIKQEELLTDEEVLRMLISNNGKDIQSIRNRAVLMLIDDSGGRISELLGAKIKDLIRDDYGIKISVEGKTGYRLIRLVNSIKYLDEWIEYHPGKSNPESPLFVSLHKNFCQAMGYTCACTILKRMAKKANITKEVNPHAFRHRRCTEMAKQGFMSEEMRLHFGWEKGSSMASRYNHIEYEDVDRKILQKAGKTIKEDTGFSFKQKLCPKCNKELNFEQDKCDCGHIIINRILNETDRNEEKIVNVKKVLDYGLNDPRTKDKLTNLLKEIVEGMQE